jgi:DNA (cytosine-5)-methyltransferase 1
MPALGEISSRQTATIIIEDDDWRFPRQGARSTRTPASYNCAADVIELINADAVPSSALQEYSHRGLRIVPGMTVQANIPPGAVRCQFLRVTKIIKLLTNRSIRLQGIKYAKSECVPGLLDRRNEVCAVYEGLETDRRPIEEQGKIEIPVEDVIAPRYLTITNAPWPRYCEPPHDAQTEHFRGVGFGTLVCRWEYQVIYQSKSKKDVSSSLSKALVRIREGSVDRQRFAVRDRYITYEWIGGAVKRGGSHQAPPGLDPQIPPREDFCNLTERPRAPGQRYTFFDAFCGAGGASRGAKMAGFHIQYALDKWDAACESYRNNFRTTKLFEGTADEFFLSQNSNCRADVLHLSPPCQYWSPAHTVDCPNDEANMAALLSCPNIIKTVRPRIFTMEQTFGLVSLSRSMCYFTSLVTRFTKLGYSVRWKVVKLAAWGVPGRRQRLIMIGSCPGLPLPPFPKDTHSEFGEVPGTRPFVVIREALSKIRDGTTLHRIPRWNGKMRGAPYSDQTILQRTMTTSGGGNFHFSGKRDYTLREYACLQGFPTYHQFVAPYQKAQIGNAFPPCAVKVLYEHLEQWLMSQDRVTPDPSRLQPQHRASSTSPPDDAIIINDEDNMSAIDLSNDDSVIVLDDWDDGDSVIMLTDSTEATYHTIIDDD